MRKDINIADIVVHLHPESSCDDRNVMEQELREHEGVVSVHFDTNIHPHSLVVAYNPEVISSALILEGVRKCDNRAVMAGI